MFNPLKSSVPFLLLLLARSSTAQFAAYPACVQPLLYDSFPAACLSDSLALQNTCLCKDANAAGNVSVPIIAQKCGCADLTQTIQLTNAYCAQVGIDTGPAYEVFVQDDTTCGTGGSGSSTGSGAGGGATSTGAAVVPTNTQGSGGSGGATVTVTAAAGSTGSAGHKSSDANRGVITEGIVVIGAGVIMGAALCW